LLNKVQGGDYFKGVSDFFMPFFSYHTHTSSAWVKDRKYNFGRKVMSNQTTIRPP